MAEHNEDVKRRADEPSGHTNNGTNKARRGMTDVNFDEMNFEQRRAPYNSGRRNIAEREYDRTNRKNDDGPTRDTC